MTCSTCIACVYSYRYTPAGVLASHIFQQRKRESVIGDYVRTRMIFFPLNSNSIAVCKGKLAKFAS